jgi:hypothetical protein
MSGKKKRRPTTRAEREALIAENARLGSAAARRAAARIRAYRGELLRAFVSAGVFPVRRAALLADLHAPDILLPKGQQS